MSIALDTNILAYALGVERHPKDVPKIALCREMIPALVRRSELFVPVQVFAELYYTLMRHGRARDAALEDISRIKAYAQVLPSAASTFDAAIMLAVNHHLQIFDAIVVCAASERRARWLLTEDMQDGWSVGGVTLYNPIGKPLTATLAHLGLAQ